MASGGRQQKDDEGSGSWFKFAAAVGAAAIGTYAVVKIAQHVTKEEEPPMPSRYSGGSNAWQLRGESYCADGGFSVHKRKPFDGGNNMGKLWSSEEQVQERNSSAHGCGLVLEEEEPWCLSTQNELEIWYNENIQLGTEEFATHCRLAIDSVVKHVHRNCSTNILDFDVGKVVKGGSLGKGTMVKDLSDVDLVAFVNKPYLKPIAEIGKEEYKRTLLRIISDIKSTLRGVPNVKIIHSNDYLVNFKIQVGSRRIVVDLLPTTDNAKSLQSCDELFRSMLEVENTTREYYSASFVQNQVRFVKEQPGYVKELIRLVKYWAHKFLPKYLQKSYHLELITIHLWEKAGKPGRHLNKAQGLRSVLEVLRNLDSLCASWNYVHRDEDLAEAIMVRLDMKRPIVLDPANPTNNVCWNYRSNKQVLAAAAERTLHTDLLRDITAWPQM